MVVQISNFNTTFECSMANQNPPNKHGVHEKFLKPVDPFRQIILGATNDQNNFARTSTSEESQLKQKSVNSWKQLHAVTSAPCLSSFASNYALCEYGSDEDDNEEPASISNLGAQTVSSAQDKKAEFRKKFYSEYFGSGSGTSQQEQVAAGIPSNKIVLDRKIEFVKRDILNRDAISSPSTSVLHLQVNAAVSCQDTSQDSNDEIVATPVSSIDNPMEQDSKCEQLCSRRQELLRRFEHFGFTDRLFELAVPANSVNMSLLISFVQFMTRTKDFDSGQLCAYYVLTSFDDTEKSLNKYEDESAPPGWRLQWSKENNRYQYNNIASGVIQFTYPTEELQTDTANDEPEIKKRKTQSENPEDDEYEQFLRSLDE